MAGRFPDIRRFPAIPRLMCFLSSSSKYPAGVYIVLESQYIPPQGICQFLFSVFFGFLFLLRFSISSVFLFQFFFCSLFLFYVSFSFAVPNFGDGSIWFFDLVFPVCFIGLVFYSISFFAASISALTSAPSKSSPVALTTLNSGIP